MADSNPQTSSALNGGGNRPGGPPRYSLANSYSSFVGFMKLALPAIGLGVILLIVIWPQLREEGRVAIESLEVTEQDLTDRKMLNPRYESFDSDDRPFTITAKEASQNAADKDLIDLDTPKARLQMANGRWVDVNAPLGTYDEGEEVVHLDGGVALNHEDGIEIRTQEVDVRVAKGTAVSRTPVTGTAPEGTLEGEGFRLIEEGRVIFLNGKSRVVLYEQDKSDDSVPATSGKQDNEQEAEPQ